MIKKQSEAKLQADIMAAAHTESVQNEIDSSLYAQPSAHTKII